MNEDEWINQQLGGSSAPRSMWQQFVETYIKPATPPKPKPLNETAKKRAKLIEDNYLLSALESNLSVGPLDILPEPVKKGIEGLIPTTKDMRVPLSPEAVYRTSERLKGVPHEEISRKERTLKKKLETDISETDASMFDQVVTSLTGGMAGGVDPTYVLAPGRGPVTRIASQAAINAGVDAANQGTEIERDVRDAFDPVRTAIAGGGGALLQGGGEVVRAIARPRLSSGLTLDDAVGVGNKFGTVTSTVRSKARNKKVGGVPNSFHLSGQAIDVARGKGVSHKALERAYRRAGFDIIESLDEGDHSHFAFRFGKPKQGGGVIEDFDFNPREQGPDPLGDIRLVRDELPDVEEMARVNEALSPEAENIVRMSFDDPIGEPPRLDSAYDRYTPYVDRPSTPANDQPTPEELEDAARLAWDEMTNTLEGSVWDPIKKKWIERDAEGVFKEPLEDTLDRTVLTPAERQEIDASATRPDIPPVRPAGLGKGSVATTPVNDLRTTHRPETLPGSRDGSEDYPLPPFPGEEGFPEPGTPGNRGGPKGGSDDPVEIRLIADLKKLKPMTGEQRALYREERSRRGSSLSNLQRGDATRENIAQQFASQRGQLPRKAYQSIADNYTEADFTSLANRINQSPRLLPFQKLNAHKALLNLLGAEGAKLPTPSEIKLLSEVYSEDFVKALLENRTFLQKAWQNTKSVLNVPRAIMSSMDFSAPFRQGIGLVHKKEFWKSLPHMFKMWADTMVGGNADKAWMDSVKSHPRWAQAVEANLGITDPHSHFLADREEDFMTDLAERIPFGFGRLIKGSNSAYSGFLNKLRWDTFNNLIDQKEAMGEVVDEKFLKQLGKFVNMATGRGDLGKMGNAAAPALSALLFSPRLIASRVKTLASPVTYMTADPMVRKEAWKSLLAMSAYYLTLGGIAKYMLGMEIETDSRSPDFMKAKIGNTRYDFMAGYSQYIRLGAQLLTDSTITAKGDERELTANEGYRAPTRRDVAIKFFLNKLAPVPSLVSDWMEGSDSTGEPFEWKKAIKTRMLPMASQDIADAIEEWGPVGAAMGLPGLIGWSVQTYEPKAAKAKEAKPEEDLFDDDWIKEQINPEADVDKWLKEQGVEP